MRRLSNEKEGSSRNEPVQMFTTELVSESSTQDKMDAGDPRKDDQDKEMEMSMEGNPSNTQKNNGSASPSSADADFKSTSEALIKKLLQLSAPRLDVKIVGVLLLEGMMDIFMSHITRLDGSSDIDLKTLSLSEQLTYAVHPRDNEDLKATKRSYHAMEILCGTSANHFWVQDSRFSIIASHLFEVFLPHSNGNLNHFGKIFQHFVRRHPCDMLQLIIFQNNATLFFDYMLPYITEGPVMDSVLSLIFVRDINAETREKRELSHARLQELGFLERLLDAVQVKDRPTFSEAAEELLLRIIEEASQVDNGDILLKSLQAPTGHEIIETLVKLIVQRPPSKERSLTINVLKVLVKSGMLITRASAMSQPVQGPLYMISVRSQELLSKHIASLCSVIVNDRTSTTKLYPLTTADIELVEIIYQTLQNANDKVEMLTSTTPAFWKILVNSFFEKSASSIYHTLFYRIFCLLLNIHHEPTLVILIRKQKLLTRMIEVYRSPSQTDTRGFILLILNHLRLTADAHHNTLVHRIITSHPKFQEFLPTLRADTIAQIEPANHWKLDTCPRPPPHIGPSPPIRSVPFSPYAATLPLMGGSNEADEATGIDLGSDFAYCLGFDQTARVDGMETPMDHLSRRNSFHSSSGESSQSESNSRPSSPGSSMLNGLVFESLTPEEPSTSKKKRKKKKKNGTTTDPEGMQP
ncbi:hypothetical protein EC973_008828 [Apophysomyces ossiformis]|uniref:Uncharacterized protein n=1 Tax=Apophysomyces ossiformis TaxID=679940 RepID=A0A8H7BUY7_9FUNG|nr:hypothetical protein EC973_008828 [Apophysomyces ossiformis]